MNTFRYSLNFPRKHLIEASAMEQLTLDAFNSTTNKFQMGNLEQNLFGYLKEFSVQRQNVERGIVKNYMLKSFKHGFIKAIEKLLITRIHLIKRCLRYKNKTIFSFRKIIIQVGKCLSITLCAVVVIAFTRLNLINLLHDCIINKIFKKASLNIFFLIFHDLIRSIF